jgi:hypothetical protein
MHLHGNANCGIQENARRNAAMQIGADRRLWFVADTKVFVIAGLDPAIHPLRRFVQDDGYAGQARV